MKITIISIALMCATVSCSYFNKKAELKDDNVIEQSIDVLFIDASQDFDPGKNNNRLAENHIDKIIQTFEERKELPKFSHIASFEEIEENDFNLNITRYVDTFEEEEDIDVMALQVDIEQLEGELANVRSKMATILQEINQ